VDELQPGADIEREGQRFRAGEGTGQSQPAAESLALEILHGEECRCRAGTSGGQQKQLVNAANLRPADFACQLNFVPETLEGLTRRVNIGADGFERDAAELEVFGLENLAHAAFSEKTNDAKTVEKNFPGPEPGRPRFRWHASAGYGTMQRRGLLLLFSLKQQKKMVLQPGIGSANFLYEGSTRVFLLFHGGVEQGLEALPELGRHGVGASPWQSHSRAILTAGTETPGEGCCKVSRADRRGIARAANLFGSWHGSDAQTGPGSAMDGALGRSDVPAG